VPWPERVPRTASQPRVPATEPALVVQPLGTLDIHAVEGQRRRLVAGDRSSVNALRLAASFGILVGLGYTFVRPHRRGGGADVRMTWPAWDPVVVDRGLRLTRAEARACSRCTISSSFASLEAGLRSGLRCVWTEEVRAVVGVVRAAPPSGHGTSGITADARHMETPGAVGAEHRHAWKRRPLADDPAPLRELLGTS
jgi:hypothetical protein